MSFPEFKRSDCCNALLHVEPRCPDLDYKGWSYVEQERCAMCGKVQEPRPGLHFRGTKPIFVDLGFTYAPYVPCGP